MKYLLTIFLSLLIGILLTYIFLTNYNSSKTLQDQSDIITEKIEQVNKLISLESSIAQVYTIDQTQKLFFDLIPIPKQAIVIARAKIYVAYDLSKMSYQLNQDEKQVILSNIPEPQIIVEPNLQFYDLKADILPFTKQELTHLNQRATELIKQEGQNKELLALAKKSLSLNLKEITMIAQEQDWEVLIR